MSKTSFLFQGIDLEVNILQDVKRTISTSGANVLITSAYLRRRAVEELAPTLKQVGQLGKVLVGIRNGATSAQALTALVKTGVHVYVVDTGATELIFHPKFYAAYTENSATLICGSANFTPSGLWRNFESVTITELDLENEDDYLAWSSVLDAIEKVLNLDTQNVFEVRDVSIVNELLASGRVVDEDRTAPIRSVGRAEIENGKGIPRINAKSKKPSTKSSSVVKERKTAQKRAETVWVTPAVTHERYVEIWKSKPLVRRDLNLPDSKGTNPTGSMLLKKGLYDIDQQTYFRYEAFANHEWTSRKGKPSYFEYAEVNFRFVVNGIDYGVHRLEIKFDSRTNTATYLQKQPMASISWGECKQFLASEALLERTMTIYRDTATGEASKDGSRRNATYVIEIE